MPRQKIQAVVFDLDGLMFNTEELYIEVGSEVLRRRGCQFTPELLDAMMGRRPRQAIELMIQWTGLTNTVDQIEAESTEIFAPLLETRLQTMPGLMPLLAALEASGIPKAVATSSPRQFAERVLSSFELIPRFQFLLTAEDVTHGKPHPEIYVTAAGRLGLAPQQVLVLEDSQTGCQAAVAAGTVAVAVPGHVSQHHNFDGAALVLQSLQDAQLYRTIGIDDGCDAK
jgi:HAD superfamily hydrolase (TIGR01509 family)